LNLPSAATGGRITVGGKDSVLAGADVVGLVSSLYRLLVASEGFFVMNRFESPRGSQVAVAVWRFWLRKKLDADLARSGKVTIQTPDEPPPDLSPEMGEPHRNGLVKVLESRFDAVFLLTAC